MQTEFPQHLSPKEKAPLLEFHPIYYIRTDDMKSEIGNSDNPRRLNGCCGLDGCDGPNKICLCGEHVGTEKSDCWTPLVFIPNIETTDWIAIK